MGTSAKLDLLQRQIEPHLERIERLLPNYRLTLVARCLTHEDADILLSMDDLSKVIDAVKALQERDGVET